MPADSSGIPRNERPGSGLGSESVYRLNRDYWPLAEWTDDLVDEVRPITGVTGGAPDARLGRSTEIARDLWRRLAAELSEDQSGDGLPAELHSLVKLTKNLKRDLEEFGEQVERDRRRFLRDAEASRKAADVQEREARTFDLRDPDGRITARVTPKPYPVTLQVASPSHGEVSFPGVARFFPKHTVHARDCTAVVEGNNCELQSEDHYHVQHTSVSLEPLLEEGSAQHAAFLDLLDDPSDAGVRRFQREMTRCSDGPSESRNAQASVPLRQDPRVVLSGVAAVHQGDGTRTNLKTRYIVEDSELPIVELLAEDKSLVESLVAASAEDKDGPAARAFYRGALRAAGRVDDARLLDYATDLHDPGTVLSGFFGTARVTRASAVMIGTGNTLQSDMQVHRVKPDRGAILADLGQIRELAAPDPDELPGVVIVSTRRDGADRVREILDSVLDDSPDDPIQLPIVDGPESDLDCL
jgi:hypothetical protein